MSMEAGMCSCDAGLEPSDVCDIADVKARKEHRCDECHETIQPGQTYVRIKALWDGGWETMKRCRPCYQIGTDYCCGVIGKGAVWEWCWEYLGVNLITGETKGEGE